MGMAKGKNKSAAAVVGINYKERAKAARAAANAAQEARHQANLSAGVTPWQVAKAKRAERRRVSAA